jgi:surface protein
MSPRRGGGHVADRASRGHSAPRAGVRAAVYALTLAALFAAPTPALAQDQLGGGWTKVRHVPSGNSWHPAKDRLVGTETYGDSNVDSVAWSIDFESAAPGYNQFLFSSGDGSLWLVATKSAVVGEYYSNGLRDVMASSSNADAYQAKWYRRSGNNEDPWISVGNFATGVVYGGNAVGGNLAVVQNNGGADVYVRAACDAFTPPFNGDFGTCTGYLVYGQSCVPTCNPGFVLEGLTSCTDRALTEAVCIPDVATRAELKAAVDSCVGDQLCELTMPLWDVSQVTDMSFLFQNMTGFDVDISRWNVSQVTDARGMFESATNFYWDLSGWTFADNADTTGMFTGADTWLTVKSRTDGFDSKDGPPGAWVFNKCLENERVENGLCAPCTGGGTRAAGDDPALGVDTGCTFPDRAALKAAVDNCIAVDPTGVACCSKPWVDCGAAGTAEMADWDVSQVTSMINLFNGKASFNADISRWDVSSVRSMGNMFLNAYAFNQHLSRWDVSSVTDMQGMFANNQGGTPAFNQHLSRWDVSSVTTMRHMFDNADAFNKMPEGWDTSKVTDSYRIFYSADAWYARFTGGGADTLPDRGWTRKDNACDASLPPLNGAVGTCTDTLMSGTSCVPECNTGFVLEGVTSCTNRVLTEAVCTLDVTTRAELKATVDACVGDRLCELTMPHWDVSRVTDMSFLFEGKTDFNVDISRWNVSQVTDARGMFQGATNFYRNIIGWTFPNNANTTGMFTGADTWFSRASRNDTLYTTDGPPGAWVLNMCLDQERVELGVCAPCTHGGTNAAGDNPALGIDTGCAFPDSAALKAAVDRCLAVDPTGVACCSHGANCGAAGTAEMAVWDVSLVTDMSELFKSKASFNADISRWYVSSVTSMYRMFYSASNFNADISRWDVSSVTSMSQMFAYASSFNRSLRRWNTNAVDNEQWSAGTYIGRVDLYTFSDATAWYARYATCGYKTDAVCSDVVDFSNDLSFIFHYSYNGDRYALAAFVRKDNACDASTPPYFGGVGNCTDTLMSGTSCVPTCDPGYVLNGVTSCTDRVRLAVYGSRRAEGDRGRVLGCCAVWGEVLLQGSSVLAPGTGQETMRRRGMRGHA